METETERKLRLAKGAAEFLLVEILEAIDYCTLRGKTNLANVKRPVGTPWKNDDLYAISTHLQHAYREALSRMDNLT